MKARQTFGNYLARIVRNSFKLIPILTSGSPLPAAHSTLRPHQLPPHVPSTFGFIIGLRAITLPFGPTRHRLLRRRRDAPLPSRPTRRSRQRHRRKNPSSAENASLRVILLAFFAPSLTLTSGQIVRGQTQYASFGQPGTDRFVRRLCTPLLR